MNRLLLIGWLILPLFVASSCGKTPGSSDDPADTGPDPDTSPDTSPDTEPVPKPPDYVVVSVDSEILAEQGYELVTFELNPEAADQYESLSNKEQELDADGNPIVVRPTFFVARPIGTEGESLTELFYFHGGTIADDRDFEETGEMPAGCGLQLRGFAKFGPLIMAADEGWAMVLPRNDWCDYWTGLGPDDPVDPQRHFGYYHVNRILDFLATGSAGYMPSGERFGWGTSAGGGAALHIQQRHGSLFQAIIVDSAPSSMFRYHTTDPDAVESILGGPPYDEDGEPTPFWESYSLSSAEWLISDHNFRVPISMFWNFQDESVRRFYPESILNAFETYYSPGNVAWDSYDLNHQFPGPKYHVQTKFFGVPSVYVGGAAVSFLKGKQARWLEAEAGCSGELEDVCTIGVVVKDGEDGLSGLQVFSGGSVRKGTEAEPAGVLWSDTLPLDLPRDRPIRAVAVVKMEGIDTLADSTELVRLSFQTESGEKNVVLTRSDFARRDDPTTEEILHQYRSTGIDIVIPAEEVTTLSWYSEGVGRTHLDAFVFIFDPEE